MAPTSDAGTPSNGNGYTRIGVYASAASALFVVVAAFIWIGTIASQVSQNSAAHGALALRLGAVEVMQRQTQIDITRLETSQVETETQFCASDIVRNLMHANDMREIAMLHNAVFHTTYPTDNAYYPVICRRDTQTK